MNLYEFEGKQLFSKYGIKVPKGENIKKGDDPLESYSQMGGEGQSVVVKSQVLSGKRGKNGGIKFCDKAQDVAEAVKELFSLEIRGQHTAAVRLEEKLDIAEEHYMSITYNTSTKQPVLIYSTEGGMDIEDVAEEKITTHQLNIREKHLGKSDLEGVPRDIQEIAERLYECFLEEDCRLVEINPLVRTSKGELIAADAKVALDDDAFYRHEDWNWEPRTMMGRPPTQREIEVAEIDKGEKYYQGTAGKYIEMDGDIAILFSGGGASIANMDALISHGLKPANYTEYSGNPPREKVSALTKIVLSKPGLKGLWIAGGVANFTNVRDTFQGIVDALDDLKPTYPIVIRRAGPFEEEGMQLMRECAERNNLDITIFGKEMSMSDSAAELAKKVK